MQRYMKKKISSSTEALGVCVDDDLHSGLSSVMTEFSDDIERKYAPDSFHRLFWTEQMKAMNTKPTLRRWHPMLIRWCLHLKMLSSSAYNSLRRVLTLPCGRTLQDYTHWIEAESGVQPEVTQQLMQVADIESLPEWKKCIAVVFDEVKVKEGIVYDKHNCRIVGFVDLGEVNNTFLTLERSGLPVAKHILLFMVRGIFFKLNFPYAQFPTRDLTAEDLYPVVWEVIKNLECAGFRVVSLTGDKASVNRKFFNMHKRASGSAYRVRNPYSREERYIFFISDVPHLIKTVRNCWANSFAHSYKRPLWVCIVSFVAS